MNKQNTTSSTLCGISFQIPQEVAPLLYEMLGDSLSLKYTWHCDLNQSEVLNESQENNFFDAETYAGAIFQHKIQENHYLVFLKLEAYPQHKEVKIQSYKDFLDSDCQIVLLVYDCEYVEIYSKSSLEIKELYENAKKASFTNVQYILEEERDRFCMDIL